MKRKLIVVFLLLSLLLSSCSYTKSIETNLDNYEDYRQERIDETLRILSSDEFKGRFPGAEGNTKAIEYISDEFKSIALDPVFDTGYLHKYNQDTYSLDDQEITFTATFKDNSKKTYIYGKDYFDSIKSENYEKTLDVVFDDEANDETKDSVILLKDKEKLKELDRESNLIITITKDFFGMSRLDPHSPVIYITQEVYDELKEQQAQTIYIKSKYEAKNIETSNIVGKITGKDNSKALVISAHFDHVGWAGDTIFNGAVDNASGVTVVLDLAKRLKTMSQETEFNMDIIFAAFNGEEFGLHGSKAFVNDISSKYDEIYNLNIDCIGKKDGGSIILDNESLENKQLVSQLQEVFAKRNVSFVFKHAPSSDHKSFNSKGFSGITIGQELVFSRDSERGIHTPLDTIENIEVESLIQISDSILDFIEINDGKIFEFEGQGEMTESDRKEKIQGKMYDIRKEKDLKYNQHYITVIDGSQCEIYGDNKFSNIEEIKEYYPDIQLTLPDTLLDFDLKYSRVAVSESTYIIHEPNTKKYDEDELDKIITRDLTEEDIVSVSYNFTDENFIGVNVYINKKMKPQFLDEDFLLKEVDVLSDKYYITTGEVDTIEGFYKEINFNDNTYHILVRKMGPNLKSVPFGNGKLIYPDNTEEEIIELIQEIDIEETLKELGMLW